MGVCSSGLRLRFFWFVCFVFLSHFNLFFLFYFRYWDIISTLPLNAFVEGLGNYYWYHFSFPRAFYVSDIFTPFFFFDSWVHLILIKIMFCVASLFWILLLRLKASLRR